MSQGKRKLARIGGVVALCGALGAGGAYVGSAASPSSSSAAAGKAKRGGQHAGQRRGSRGALKRAVHAEAVVPTQGGKFVTVTVDRGVVEKVEGSQLTLREGTRQASYKTVTLDVPSDAVVRINRQPGKLSDVKAGQRAMVVHGAKKTRVVVRDARNGSKG
ncbi:MAG: hypothetical protein DLM61_14950 [Pseudonocardiales bacterium]|nr:MAG: hypothetical protein DLM61_14950 [Pseudonocardiales bacterium]